MDSAKLASMLALTGPIDYETPCIYRPYVRDYVKLEILEIFASQQLLRHETRYSLLMLDEPDRAWLLPRFRSCSWSTADRGDE